MVFIGDFYRMTVSYLDQVDLLMFSQSRYGHFLSTNARELYFLIVSNVTVDACQDNFTFLSCRSLRFSLAYYVPI